MNYRVVIFEDHAPEREHIEKMVKYVLRQKETDIVDDDVPVKESIIRHFDEVIGNQNNKPIRMVITDILHTKYDLDEFWDCKKKISESMSDFKRNDIENEANNLLIQAGIKNIISISEKWNKFTINQGETALPIFIITKNNNANLVSIFKSVKDKEIVLKMFTAEIEVLINSLEKDQISTVHRCGNVVLFLKQDYSTNEEEPYEGKQLEEDFYPETKFEKEFVRYLTNSLGLTEEALRGK